MKRPARDWDERDCVVADRLVEEALFEIASRDDVEPDGVLFAMWCNITRRLVGIGLTPKMLMRAAGQHAANAQLLSGPHGRA